MSIYGSINIRAGSILMMLIAERSAYDRAKHARR